MHEEIIAKIPRIVIPKYEKREKPVINKEKLFEMLRDLDPFYGCIVGLTGRSGLRIGEAVVLKVEDIDYDQKTIFVRRRQYAYETEEYTKTNTSYGKLPVYDEVLHLIRRHCNWDSGWLFPGQNGDAYHYNNIYKGPWKKICDKYDLPPRFGPHCMRHTFGYILLKDGVNIKAIQKLMRHANIQTTLNQYGHYLTQDIR